MVYSKCQVQHTCLFTRGFMSFKVTYNECYATGAHTYALHTFKSYDVTRMLVGYLMEVFASVSVLLRNK